jgi:hypothetical protein
MNTYPENPPEDLICECGRHLPCRHCPPEGEGLGASPCSPLLFRSEFYDEWNAWAINLPKLRIILIFQHPRYWEWVPRKCHIWDRKLNDWTGYHFGPFEISWEND